jgi:hypothetical protein
MDRFATSLKYDILDIIGRIDYVLNMFADDLLVIIEEKFLVQVI